MPSKSSVRRRKQAAVGHRHHAQVQSAADALMVTSPTRRSPVAQLNQAAGPSSPYRFGSRDRRALIIPPPIMPPPVMLPPDRRVLFSPSPTRRRLISPLPPNRQPLIGSPPIFTNPFYTPGGTQNPSLMDLDGQSGHSVMSAAPDRMSVTPDNVVPQVDSDGSSTVGPLDFHHNHPHLPSPPNTYFLNVVELDNLRTAVHFMHHAVLLVDGTLDTLRAQNPHCPYLRRRA